jgi:hypothetical protein
MHHLDTRCTIHMCCCLQMIAIAAVVLLCCVSTKLTTTHSEMHCQWYHLALFNAMCCCWCSHCVYMQVFSSIHMTFDLNRRYDCTSKALPSNQTASSTLMIDCDQCAVAAHIRMCMYYLFGLLAYCLLSLLLLFLLIED